MDAVVIEVKSEEDVKFWLTLAKKTGAKAGSFITDEMEDSRLADLIGKGMKTWFVSRESIMDALEQKK